MPRMTTKRWMIVVAVLAAFLSRPAYLRSIARKHEMAWKRLDVEDLEIYIGLTSDRGEDGAEVAARRKATRPIRDFSQYHRKLQVKYEDAADRPWLLVPADPPPPPMPSKECWEDFRRLVLTPLQESRAEREEHRGRIKKGDKTESD